MATPPLRQLPRGRLGQFLDSKSGQFLETLGQILGTKMRPTLQKTCIKSKKNHKFLNGLGLVFYARNWSQKLVHKTNQYLFFNYVAIFWHQKLGQKAARKLVHFWKPLEQGLLFFCTNALGARLRSVGNAVPMETQRPRGRGKRPIDTWSHHSGLLGASARRGRAEPAGRHWKRVYSCARALSCDACVFGATAARSSVTFPRTVSMQWPAPVGALPQLRELARRVADLARRKLF